MGYSARCWVAGHRGVSVIDIFFKPKEKKMNIQMLTQNFGQLANLAKGCDEKTITSFIDQLKKASPEDINKFVGMLTPLAGGQLGGVIQQLVGKVDANTITQFQQLIGKVDASQIQGLVGQLATGTVMDKAKDMLGGFLS